MLHGLGRNRVRADYLKRRSGRARDDETPVVVGASNRKLVRRESTRSLIELLQQMRDGYSDGKDWEKAPLVGKELP